MAEEKGSKGHARASGSMAEEKGDPNSRRLLSVVLLFETTGVVVTKDEVETELDQPVDLIVVDLDFLYKAKEAEFRKLRKKGLTPEKEKQALARRTGADQEIDFFYAAFAWRSVRPWGLVVGTSMMNISNSLSVKARRMAREAEFKDRLAGDWNTVIVQKPITEEKMDVILTNAVSWRKEMKSLGLD